MMIARFLVVVAGALGVAAWTFSGCSKAASERVGFSPFSEDALAAAVAAGKPSVVFATADWCGPCQILKRGALSDPAVMAALDPFVRLKIDGTDREDPSLHAVLEAHRIAGYPTLIFRDAKGAEVARLTSVQAPSAVIAAAGRASSGK